MYTKWELTWLMINVEYVLTTNTQKHSGCMSSSSCKSNTTCYNHDNYQNRININVNDKILIFVCYINKFVYYLPCTVFVQCCGTFTVVLFKLAYVQAAATGILPEKKTEQFTCKVSGCILNSRR